MAIKFSVRKKTPKKKLKFAINVVLLALHTVQPMECRLRHLPIRTFFSVERFGAFGALGLEQQSTGHESTTVLFLYHRAVERFKVKIQKKKFFFKKNV